MGRFLAEDNCEALGGQRTRVYRPDIDNSAEKLYRKLRYKM
jgi:hypothetical protein